MPERKVRKKRTDGARMPLAGHFREFQKRLMISLAALVVGAVAGWLLEGYVWDALRAPIEAISENGRVASLNYTDITSAFDLRIKLSIVLGIAISCPVWLYQIWAFLVPAMTGREKRYAVGFVLAAIPLFLGGCWAGWSVLPNIVRLMTSFASSKDAAMITATSYYDFAVKLVVIVGLAFVLPLLLVLLNFVGVLSGAAIIRSWRGAIIGIALFTAIATPAADVMSMMLLAIPMVLLYLASASVALLHDRIAARRMARFLEADTPAPISTGSEV